jgi:hypothetical protein
MKKIIIILILILLSFSTCSFESRVGYDRFFLPGGDIQLSFSVTADMMNYTGCAGYYFDGICITLASKEPGDFMVSPGDVNPPEGVLAAIRAHIGDDYPWYPAVGNHDKADRGTRVWFNEYNRNGTSLPNIVKSGPPGCEETTYSFDYGNAHFVILNEYYDGSRDHGTEGDIVDALYSWLVADLSSNSKSAVFVFGHEPAFPQPDQENGRIRHRYDSLNANIFNRDRFWNTLADYGVTAYFCGHSHNYSAVNINGVWQIESGHARGIESNGAKSTFIMVYVMDNESVFYNTYRLNIDTTKYVLFDSGQLL